MKLELEESQVEEIKSILGDLYYKSKTNDTNIENEILRLSQWIDIIVASTQKARQKIYEDMKEKNNVYI